MPHLHYHYLKVPFFRTIEIPAVASVVAFLVFGPSLPVAHAALMLSPDTPGVSQEVTIRTYRPDLDLDSDDNGIHDWIQIANGRPLDGIWTPELAAIQRTWLTQGTGSPGGPGARPTPQTPAQQKKTALEAILDANDDGPPPPDTDHDGFSDYEENWKKGQSPTPLKAAIDAGNREKRPPAYRYAIADLGSAANYSSSCMISHKNGWIAFYKNHTSLVRWHFGKRDFIETSDSGLKSDDTKFKDISNDGRMLFTYSVHNNNRNTGYTEWDSGVVNFNTIPSHTGQLIPVGYNWNSDHAVISHQVTSKPFRSLLNGSDFQTQRNAHPGLYSHTPLCRKVFPFDDGSIIYNGDYYVSGHPVTEVITDAAKNKIAVGFDPQGAEPQWFDLTSLMASTLPHYDPAFNASTHAVRINSPLSGQPQHITCRHQIWSRLAPQEHAFGDPQDLRHLIDFSEPWLDLSATGVSDEGFIVGIGKKLKEGTTPLAVPIPAAELARFTAAGVTIKKQRIYGGEGPAYGPVNPEKCGIWDHDITHYRSDDYENHAFMLIPLAIRTDANRDGKIKDDGSDTLGSGIPWRFWINDDSDDGDYRGEKDIPLLRDGGYDDVPGSGKNAEDTDMRVHGRADLPDWFAAHINGKQLLDANANIPGNPIELVFSHGDQSLHATYGRMNHDNMIPFQTTDDDPKFGLSLNKYKYEADTFKPPPTPRVATPLPRKLIDAIRADEGHVVLAGTQETRYPLKLSVMGTDNHGTPVEIAAVRLPLSLTSLYKPGKPNRFYRWVNLRHESGGDVAYPSNLSEPINWPDSATNQKNMVFVHGYYTDERLSASSAEFFKRSWWSGSRAMMTLICWAGDPPATVVSDYYESVRRAFRVAPHVAAAVNTLPGEEKNVAAHSLGNMVVSSAIVHHGLNAKHYVMLDPAVACEAYDNASPEVESGEGYVRRMRANEQGAETSYIDSMIEPSWRRGYESRTYASEFHTLFPTSDDRSRLTWRGVFAGIGNKTGVHCFHSTTEEVLKDSSNADAYEANFWTGSLLNNIMHKGEYAWLVQEWRKGSEIGTATVATTGPNRGSGGWERLGHFVSGFGSGDHRWEYFPPQTYTGLTDVQLRTQGAFSRFGDERLYTAGINDYSFVGAAPGTSLSELLPGNRDQTLAHLLACQIPALSDALGGKPSLHLTNSEGELKIKLIDMWLSCKSENSKGDLEWPAKRNAYRDQSGWWKHGDFKDVAYRYTYPLYNQVNDKLNLNNNPSP